MMLPEREVLALHQAITAIRSVSGEEAAVADFLAAWWQRRGFAPRRVGNSLLLVAPAAAPVGSAGAPPPLLLLDTHLDTVPPGPGWTRDPWEARAVGGRLYGLGANDAKGAVAGMAAAFAAFAGVALPYTLVLALVEGEETRGTGTQAVLAELAREGLRPTAAVVGEPTGLDLAIAQKGLLVLELAATGTPCHAAHAAALGAANAALRLAHDLVALDGLDLGPAHERLGATTLQPTVVHAGTARNVVPGEATAVLDVRTTPAAPPAAVVERIRRAVAGEVRVLSDRLAPHETAASALVVAAARRVRPGARLYGSATLSDMVFLQGVPAVKCGPGVSERSHTADEYIGEDEVLEGARFYTRLLGSFAEVLTETAPRPLAPAVAGAGDAAPESEKPALAAAAAAAGGGGRARA